MLRRIRIQRYKSIVDVTLDLGSVNVFSGETCTGKTNLLEALALLGAAASGNISMGMHTRGIRRESRHTCAVQSAPRGPIELEAASDRVSYRVKLDETDLTYLAEVVEVDSSAVIAREQATGWAMLARRRQVLEGLSPDSGLARILYTVAGKGAASRFLLALEALAVTKPADVLHAHASHRDLSDRVSAELSTLGWKRRVVLWDRHLPGEGQGALSMIGLFVLLLSRSAPPILAIDGPDPVLSPDMAAAFAARVRALVVGAERQLLWITNSAGALDALREDQSARVFRVARDPQRATVIDNLTR